MVISLSIIFRLFFYLLFLVGPSKMNMYVQCHRINLQVQLSQDSICCEGKQRIHCSLSVHDEPKKSIVLCPSYNNVFTVDFDTEVIPAPVP